MTAIDFNLQDFNPNEKSDLEHVPDSVRRQTRYRFLHESYFAAKNVLGYEKLRPSTHGPLCRFQDTCTAKRVLTQMPRSHFKTTIKTITKRIQDAMRDPTLRILIVGDTDTNAEKHLAKIRHHLESNNLLRWLFQDRIWENPQAQAPVWSKKELVLPSAAIHGEATFDAIGAGSAVVSRHYNIINPDDLIADDEFYSETEMAHTIEWASGLESLFVPPIEEGFMDIVGTYWRTDDVYAFFEKFFGGKAEKVKTGPYSYQVGPLAVFRRGAIEDGKPIFPEAIDMAFLERLREHNPERYAAQYANDPYASDVAYFQAQYLKYYTWHIEGHVIAYQKADGQIERIPLSSLEITGLCDPHAGGPAKIKFGGGRAAVLMTGVQRTTGRVFILDAWVKRAPTDRIISEIIRQNELWNPETFLVEANGLQKMIRPWLEERVNREARVPVPYKPFIPKGAKDSDRRIKGLQPLFRAGQIILQQGFHELIGEYLSWPRGTSDGLDALSQGLGTWGVTYDDVSDDMLEAYNERLRSMRSVATGY